MFLPSNITLSPGDSGDFVRELQRRLSSLNLYPAEGASGFYDGMTTSAVSSFQFQNGLRNDGVAGPETLRRLNGVLSGTADSTPAQTPPSTEDVMKTFYMVDHLQDATSTQQHTHDAFSFQPAQAVEPAVQQPVAAAVQPMQQAQPAMAPQQPLTAPAPAQDAAALLAQLQSQFMGTPAPQPAQQPLPQDHQHAVKPELAQPQPIPQDAAVKPAPQPQPMKPIDVMLQQPTQQPQPQPEKPPLQVAPTQPIAQPGQHPVITDKPLEQKPLEQQPAPQQPQPTKPIEQPVRATEPQPVQPQQPLEQKPAAQQNPEAEQAAPERQSLRQRFTGMMQRVAEYMESKLPQSVQAEVQKIGLQMAERGVREIPIPPSETALPSPGATPGRGPAQTTER